MDEYTVSVKHCLNILFFYYNAEFKKKGSKTVMNNKDSDVRKSKLTFFLTFCKKLKFLCKYYEYGYY